MKNLKKAASITLVAGGLAAAGAGVSPPPTPRARRRRQVARASVSGNLVQVPVHVRSTSPATPST